MKKILAVMALAFFLMLGAGSQPVSAYYLDFNITTQGTTTGQITFDRNALIGNDIEVDFVSLMDDNNVEVGHLNLNQGRLSFNSGYAGSDWDYTGGTIKITETPVTGGAPITLMDGNVNNMSVAQLGSMGPNYWEVSFGDFVDVKNVWLLEQFKDIPQSWWGQIDPQNMIGGFQGNMYVGFYGTFDAASAAFTSAGIASGDVVNYVPIPAAAWLLGSGLFGLITIRRRKK
ncbi:MAG: VPLPA-CTERM sorting domain-containing protein [Deltaproteobacteria bacterium]|nr:VPLPA-CTERM sorting domain-containing protein [Deltaproteobacteria bacterium]